MVRTEGWLARVARRFGEIVAGAPSEDYPSEHDQVPEPPRAAGHAALPLGNALPPGVEATANGRFSAGGYSFSTVAQAAHHAARLAKPIAAPVRMASPVVRAASAAPARGAVQGNAAPTRWIGESATLQIGDRRFVADLVYYGTPTRWDARDDKSRIDPSLPIDARGDPAGATLTYWQSYAGFDPKARWTYLDWLAGGRTNPVVPIGYVFVFFYGLEQRLLVDEAREEASRIFAEVRRLKGLYGGNGSFQSYASKLLALAPLYGDEEPDQSAPSAELRHNYYDLALPLDVRIRLGRKLKDDKALDAEDALIWVLALPDVYLRTPAQRCFGELKELWTLRFAARNPGGLRVRRPRSQIRYEYRAASGAFTTTATMDLPDISGTSAPLAPLRALLETCTEDLSVYSRLLGRDPDARGRLRGDMLLPAELRTSCSSLGQCRSELEGLVAGSPGVRASSLAAALDLDVEPGIEKLPATLLRQMGGALDTLGFGCEPDRRYGPSTAVRTDALLCLFPAADGGPVDHERPAYAAARGVVEVATLAAMADGEVVPAELDAIERRLRSMPDLDEREIARLIAYGRSLTLDPPKVRTALKRLSEGSPTGRAALAASAIDAVLADGVVHPDEVRFLEALHTALGLPTGPLYSALHRSVGDIGPVEVVQGDAERVIPLPPASTNRSGVPIDDARLKRIQGETTEVSAMLARIFAEEEPEPPSAPKPRAAVTDTGFEGLDQAHSALLARLIDGPLSRAEFDAAAASYRLMPDGAVETINDWGFDRFGEGVIEDDDAVRVIPEMNLQLASMGVVA